MTRYYILFENYDQGLALHDLLDQEGVKNRIAPAPAVTHGRLCCGMSLLVEAGELEAAKACIERHHAVYFDIVGLEDQLRSRRDRYC